MIITNTDGCLIGNYNAEAFKSFKAVKRKFKKVIRGDANAKIVIVKMAKRKHGGDAYEYNPRPY